LRPAASCDRLNAEVNMPKVDVVLNIVQAAMTYSNNSAINALYANLAVNRNQLQWICQGQPDNGDIMAEEAVRYALGVGPKPGFMAQAGL
jgi:hypothetical protein